MSHSRCTAGRTLTVLLLALWLPLPRPAHAGSLVFLDAYRQGVGGATALAPSPDGAHLYVTGTTGLAAVSFHARDAATGVLSYIGSLWQGIDGIDGLQGARSLTVSPDGKHVYVAGGDTVAVFGRNPTTGVLTPIEVLQDGVGGVDGILGGWSVRVSPDGKHVYVAAAADDAVAVFSRDQSSGALTFVEAEREGGAPEPGLDGAWSITLSPDGKHAYVGGRDSLKAFSRDTNTGELTFVEAYGSGAGGISNLYGVRSLSVSPDGRHLYVASWASSFRPGKLTAFSRDPLTGSLSIIERYLGGSGGVRNLSRPEAVAVSPDGGAVHAISPSDDSVAVFSRDAVSGTLAFVEVMTDGTGTTDGLEGAVALVASPDRRNLYVAGADENAVAVFSSVCGNALLDAGEQCDDGNILRDDGCNTSCQVEKCYACAGEPSLCAPDDGASCNDQNACTIDDTCLAGECLGTFADGASCDDGNGCTVSDTCAAGSCIGEDIPQVGCRKPTQAGAAQLVLKNSLAGSQRDSLAWKWLRGAETTLADFGDPRIRANYWLCVFDQSGGSSRLVLASQAPAGATCGESGSCWKTAGVRGFKYRGRHLEPDGIRSLGLRAGGAGSAKILVKGKGWRLRMLPLPLTPKVTVQLSNDETGVCWEAEYSSPSINRGTLFKAKSD